MKKQMLVGQMHTMLQYTIAKIRLVYTKTNL